MTEVTRILSAIEHGDPHAAEQLLPLVYDELRKLAAQKLVRPGGVCLLTPSMGAVRRSKKCRNLRYRLLPLLREFKNRLPDLSASPAMLCVVADVTGRRGGW
jgi:hypothetical protein